MPVQPAAGPGPERPPVPAAAGAAAPAPRPRGGVQGEPLAVAPALWPGRTVGKALLRLRIAELSGRPITPLRALKRNGGYAAGIATGGLGFVQALWDPNRQCLHDKAAHTVVLDARAP